MIHLFHDGKIEQSGSPISMYTRPVSRFAAGFIGNYNILTNLDNHSDIAIRPETLQLSHLQGQQPEDYELSGIVVDSIPRGNVLRYQIDVAGVQLYADVLFRTKALFENGDRVFLSVSDKN